MYSARSIVFNAPSTRFERLSREAFGTMLIDRSDLPLRVTMQILEDVCVRTSSLTIILVLIIRHLPWLEIMTTDQGN